MTLDITNVQTFSIHDGPGIRTTLFLAGCPLRCVWCHNPETQSGKSILAFEEAKCVLCQQCVQVCPNVHSVSKTHSLHRENCILCGKCVKACPSAALSLSQSVLTEEEYVKIVQRQQRLVGNNGGITFSGGEPLMQKKHFLHFLSLTDIHKAVETCGYAPETVFCNMLALTDYIMFDIKLADSELHKQYTGVPNHLILKNLDNLRQSGKPFILRTPLIPGITDTVENLDAIRELVGNDPWETLPYNSLTEAKYARIGRKLLLNKL